ncbi:MAG TPA: tRNA pseudouridine(55) synthase TruB [Bacteroidales bacterium]|nr:tRNA pseudouridine(55) synthase TruB [Bacteroidales bacterium]HQA85319.1 tRNA pseudouridine(55) synthase TruB [Erysipelotrichaceae bacterium]
MNGIILVNKPIGITSHDVVVKVRKALNQKRIGHTGTLDPIAEGLMILTVGKTTKILPYLADQFKEYICEMKFGQRTDTLDISGKVLEEKESKLISKDELIKVLNSFLGKSLQVPPMYSAKKVAGKTLYKLARKNIEIERKSCEIEIKEIELLEYHDNIVKFKVLCSTGTYVRVLTQDIANKTENIAVMTKLTRTKIDNFNLENAFTLQQIKEGNYNLISAYDVLSNYRYIELQDLTRVYQGKKMKFDFCNDEIVMITKDNEIIAAYQRNNEDGLYYCKRGLW